MTPPRSMATGIPHPQLPPLLREAVALHEAGKLDEALPAYQRFIDQDPSNPTGLQLFGLLHSQRGEYQAAIEYMKASLDLFPEQAEVANNLGNALSRSGLIEEAIERYTSAVRLQPRYADAWRNLGLSQLEAKRYIDAAASFRRCLELRPDDAAAWLSLGNVHKRQERFAEAIECYEKALGVRPDYAQAHHNIGVCLRMQNEPARALEHYDAARRLGLDRAELHHNRGNAYSDLRQIDEAIDAWKAAVARNPADVSSHRNLNSLLWQQERLDEYLQSYRAALASHPTAAELHLAYAVALNQQENYEAAEQALLAALGRNRDSSELVSQLAYTLENQGRLDDAIKLHAAAVNMPGSIPNHRVSFARALLASGRPDEALEQAKLGAAQMPHNQRALAYLGLCWRLLGDERDAILNDYENLVRVFEVPVPPGYSSAAEFNERLNDVLGTLHVTRRHPPEQTLRGGTQTGGYLLARREPEITALAAGFRECIADYIRRLPPNPQHPLLSRRSDHFDFSGSWSVRLRRSGYHTMHMHPMGWISSAYYVQVPPEIEESDAAGGGLKFGEPDIDIGDQGRARRQIQPAVGRLVLFPSYMWHGTIPFDSDLPRTTVAFDVVPLQGPPRAS
ncbi:MAG TPA: tetratricopeptide repeat protein [Woeseiaceae bacterium]|nr:tetratricopeptide repeat protein [Woeseiaceae bacterium]